MPLTQVNSGLLDSNTQYTGFKNRIINGAMVIDQRNAGASVATSSSSSVFTVDRFPVNYSQTSKFTAQQNAGSVTPPSGFKNYLGFTSSSAYSVLSSDVFYVQQKIEGYNVADLGWGAAGAASVTLSFWVRSSQAPATFGGAISNGAFNRSYPFSYTISVANTWEQKTITIPGDTSGTWLTTDGIGMYVFWSLGAGSTSSGTAGAWTGSGLTSVTGATSVVGTNGATFYITGVQLEKGSTATSFDYRPYGTELALCQRYFQRNSNSSLFTSAYVSYSAGNYLMAATHIPTKMRATPTVDTTGITWSLSNSATPGLYAVSNDAVNAQALTTTNGNCYFGGSGLYSLSAEL